MVVSGTSLYVTSATYDALGRPVAMGLGNGEQTQYVQCGDDCVGNVKAITIRQ